MIQNANIIDGTGKAAFKGYIAVRDGLIIDVASGHLSADARRHIDAAGLTATPGFIDIHRHADLVPFAEQPSGEEIKQGITTYFTGNCGFSAAPSSRRHFKLLQDYSRPIIGAIPDKFCGASFHSYLDAIESCPMSSNMGCLVGGGALRIAVKGFGASPMNHTELDTVKGMLGEALEAGAFGYSMGLMYTPENFYTTDEIVEICKVPAKRGRVTTVHMRGEGSSLLDSVEEVITIARRSGGAFHISHLKAAGRKNWRILVPEALELIQKAQEEGLDLSFDVYPYSAASTALYTLLPPVIQEGGTQKLMNSLVNRDTRRFIAKEMRNESGSWDNLVASTGWRSVILAGGHDKTLIGRTIEDIAAERRVTGEECVMDLLLENDGDAPIIFYSMDERDMEEIISMKSAIVISDALYSDGNGLVHPRRYGTHTRFLSRYAEKLGIEKAVRKITSLPAKRMGISNRGLLQSGCTADILILDMKKLRDVATFDEPVHYPEGILTVVMGGCVALEVMRPPMQFGRLLRKS